MTKWKIDKIVLFYSNMLFYHANK